VFRSQDVDDGPEVQHFFIPRNVLDPEAGNTPSHGIPSEQQPIRRTIFLAIHRHIWELERFRRDFTTIEVLWTKTPKESLLVGEPLVWISTFRLHLVRDVSHRENLASLR
jgi:hypothetical protein